MRKTFAEELKKQMRTNKDIVLLTGDLGYGVLDEIAQSPTFKKEKQYLNVGIREQTMVGMAAGLSLSGKIPVCYSITPFILYRPFEFIRNDLVYNKTPAVIVGSGRGKDYGKQGFTHWSEEEQDVAEILGLKIYAPEFKEDVPEHLQKALEEKTPTFLSLSRF